MDPLFEAGALDRRRALAALFGGVMATFLEGCGGGGGSAAPPLPSPSPSPTGPIAAQTSVPTPVGYDDDRLAAFDRLNELRQSAGLGLLAQAVSLDQAAQAHAAWIVANDSLAHEETAGTPGFTGTHWWDRAEAAGYVPVEGAEAIVSPSHGAQGVDALVNSVYHRAGLLAFEPVDVGIGWTGAAAAHTAMPLVIEVTRPGADAVRSAGQAAQPGLHGVAIWPVDGAVGVPLALGQEVPNPVPSQDVLSLGSPVSLTVDEETTIAVASFVMSNAATDAVVPGRVLSNASDPNGLLPRSFVALVPLSVLAPATTYRVVFTGSTTGFATGESAPVQRSWTFTTASD